MQVLSAVHFWTLPASPVGEVRSRREPQKGPEGVRARVPGFTNFSKASQTRGTIGSHLSHGLDRLGCLVLSPTANEKHLTRKEMRESDSG